MAATRQVALVTGASSGIGKATAIALAGAGFQVIGTSRNTARVTAPAGVTYLDLDVTSDESVASVVKQVIDRFGQIDVLVNNAGVGANGAAEEFSVARTQDVFDINVYGIMRMTKAVLPQMRAQRRGRVINVSSLSGFVPSPFMAIYTSTKHAVEGYSGSLDHEVREHGVRILLVEPGPINTPFGDHSVQGDTPMPLYAPGRRTFDEVLAKNTSGGDDPAVVAKVIVAAATDRNPKLRRTAGLDSRKHQRAPPRPSGPDLRPHRPQIQPDAELTLTFRVPEPVRNRRAGRCPGRRGRGAPVAMARFQPKPRPNHSVTCPHRPARQADRRAAGTSIQSPSRAPPTGGGPSCWPQRR